jgi:hypothetical protein
MRTGSVVDFDAILDELEFRLMRCSGATSHGSGTGRKGGVLAIGEHVHRIARTETKHFWNENKITTWPPESLVRLVDEMLARQPRYLSWSLVSLLTEIAPQLINDELILRTIEWISDGEPVDRVVRDAFTLTVVVQWLKTVPSVRAIQQLLEWCESSGYDRSRMGYMGLGAYLRAIASVPRESLDAAFSVCLKGAARVDVETALAVGWALREVLAKDEERLAALLEKRITVLSRQVLRTAIERLHPPVRRRLSEKWLLYRRSISGRSAKEYDTGIRSRRIPIGHRQR